MRRLPGRLALAIAIASLARPAIAGPAAAPGASAEPALARLRALPSPAGPGSLAPHLSRSRDGEVWLSWLEPRPRGGHALKVSRLDGQRWSAPLGAAEGDSFFVNWADRPGVLALGEGRLAAHWLWTTSPEAYSYEVRIAFSDDRGRTWGRFTRPHRDDTATEHGFVTLLPEADGVRAIWLDGRNYAAARARKAPAAGKDGGHEVDADMTVRTALVRRDGTLQGEAEIDGRACDCCPTAAAATRFGMLVAYRDRSPAEVRDIGLVRGIAISDRAPAPRAAVITEMAWSEPYPLHADGWRIPGCPVNGPALSAEDDRVAIAWYSEAGDWARVLAAFSEDGGRSFGEPTRVDDGQPMGRVDVALLEDGSALVLWLEAREKDAEVLARSVTPGGTRSEVFRIAATSSKRASGYPRMVRDGRRALFAWTEAGKPPRVRLAEAMTRER